jgi:nucleotide-binding universal stress UspA family protein
MMRGLSMPAGVSLSQFTRHKMMCEPVDEYARRERRMAGMYKSILVPLDGSALAEAVLPEIEKLARCMGARIILLRVSRAHIFPGKDPTKAEIEVVRRAEEYVAEVRDQLAAKGLDAEACVRYGAVAEEILTHSARNDIDLIAMSTHGRSGLGRWALGSVAEKIVRRSVKPVLLMRAKARTEGED